MLKGKLVLLPNLLFYHKNWKSELPAVIETVVAHLDGLICESAKAARRFLALFRDQLKIDVNLVPLMVMEKQRMINDVDFFFEPIMKGENWGLVVDSGLACIADPGSKLVKYAYEKHINVQAYAGPSAIVHALQLSGFYAQQFHFLGYLPKDRKGKIAQIRKLGFDAKTSVQIFIETPYRCNQTLCDLLENLPDNIELCIAKDLFMESQEILRGELRLFKKKEKPQLKNRQCVFLINHSC